MAINFLDSTTLTVATGAGLLGFAAGLAGSFAVVRKQSLQGDVVSHAALPGIAIGFLLGSQTTLGLAICGGITGWLALEIVAWLSRRTKTSPDSALAIVLAAFFGLGLVLKSIAQRKNSSSEYVGLDQFLFGQAATIRLLDVWQIGIVTCLIALIIWLCWHRLFIVSFDSQFANSIGISSRFWLAVLTNLIVTATIIGLQSVGVVLMSALLVAPVIAAKYCSNRLQTVVLLSGMFGSLAGIAGTILTASTARIPTGPIIVLLATAIAASMWMLAKLNQIRRKRNQHVKQVTI